MALIDGKVAGTGSLDGDEIKAVFVDPSYQRRGIGRNLMEELEGYAKRIGLKEVMLKSSITGFEFYKALHYRRVKKIVENFQGDKLITYLMKKHL